MSKQETRKLKEALLIKAESMRLAEFRKKAQEELNSDKELPTFPITIGGEVLFLRQEEIIMYDMFISHVMLFRKSEETDHLMGVLTSGGKEALEEFVSVLKESSKYEEEEDKTTLKSNISKEREKSDTNINVIIDKLGQEQ